MTTLANMYDKIYCVYKHTSPSGKVYIGITCQKPERRWGKNGERYKSKAKSGDTYFWKAIQKYGWENIKHEIIASKLTREAACMLEQELIKKYNSFNSKFGYNLTLGGESNIPTEETRKKLSLSRRKRKLSKQTKEKIRAAHLGKIVSIETRMKQSMLKKGKPSPRKGYKFTPEEIEKSRLAHKGQNKGRPVSEETRRKISEAQKGKKISQEAIEKMRLAHKGKKLTEEQKLKLRGRKLTEETKRKISQAHKGKKISEQTKEKLRIINTGRTFSEESRRKMSEVHKGKKHPLSKATIAKIAAANRGRKNTEETKRKISQSKKGKVIVSERTRLLLSIRTKEYWNRKKGIKNVNNV